MVIFRAHGDVAIAVKERQFAVQALLNSSGLFQHRNQEQDLYAEHWPQRGFYPGMDVQREGEADKQYNSRGRMCLVMR